MLTKNRKIAFIIFMFIIFSIFFMLTRSDIKSSQTNRQENSIEKNNITNQLEQSLKKIKLLENEIFHLKQELESKKYQHNISVLNKKGENKKTDIANPPKNNNPSPQKIESEKDAYSYILDPSPYFNLNNGQEQYFNDSLINEEIDPNWSYNMERKIFESLRSLPVSSENIDVLCRTTFCKIEIQRIKSQLNQEIIADVTDSNSPLMNIDNKLNLYEVDISTSYRETGNKEVITHFIARDENYSLPFFPNYSK